MPRGRSKSRGRSTSRGRSRVRFAGSTPVRSKSRRRSKSRGRKGPLATPVAVVVETPTTAASGAVPKRKSRKNRKGKGNKLQKEITALKHLVEGPKVENTFTTTVTLGSVDGNLQPKSTLERSMKWYLHPCLLKESDSAGASTPLTDRAKDYALYKILKVHLKFMPLVNLSNVSGTIVIASLDLDAQAAKNLNVDDLLTRPNIRLSLGQHKEWTIPARNLEGPRETWWAVNTNEVATETCALGFDVHTYGTTYNLAAAVESTATNLATLPTYSGPLFLVQATVTYGFSNFEIKPALATLQQNLIEAENAVFTTDGDNNLNIELTEPPTVLVPFWQKANQHETHLVGPRYRHSGVGAVAASEGLGTTIWSIASDVVGNVAGLLPGPWSWLLKGGFFLVRKLLGGPAEKRFMVYPSIEDAQRNNPVQNPEPLPVPIKIPLGTSMATQINSPNVQTNATGSSGSGPATLPISLNTTMPELNPMIMSVFMSLTPTVSVECKWQVDAVAYVEFTNKYGKFGLRQFASQTGSHPGTDTKLYYCPIISQGTRHGIMVIISHTWPGATWDKPTNPPNWENPFAGCDFTLLNSLPDPAEALPRGATWGPFQPANPGTADIGSIGQISDFTGKAVWVAPMQIRAPGRPGEARPSTSGKDLTNIDLIQYDCLLVVCPQTRSIGWFHTSAEVTTWATTSYLYNTHITMIATFGVGYIRWSSGTDKWVVPHYWNAVESSDDDSSGDDTGEALMEMRVALARQERMYNELVERMFGVGTDTTDGNSEDSFVALEEPRAPLTGEELLRLQNLLQKCNVAQERR